MFDESERQIFKVQVGGKTLAYDPLDLNRKLMTLAHKHEVDLEAEFALLAADGDKLIGEQLKALGALIDIFREAFDMPKFALDDAGNETGFLDNEVLESVGKFAKYVETLKKNTVSTPSSSPPSGSADLSITNSTPG